MRKVKHDNKAPSEVLLAARLKTGAGKHGGSVRQKNRRERANVKRDLRNS